jgi:hypothetical protein
MPGNNNDIVPRVPPGYQHVGKLYHFDASGNLESSIESMAGVLEDEAAGPRMLTETEFDRMRAQLLEQRAQARASGLESLEAPMLEGIIPSVSDHSMGKYIAKIAAKVGSPT